MLILTRRPGESIKIVVPPGTTEVTITMTQLGVKGNQVRYGIDAPRNVSIDREEIYQRKLGNGEFNGNI